MTDDSLALCCTLCGESVASLSDAMSPQELGQATREHYLRRHGGPGQQKPAVAVGRARTG